MEIIVFGCGKGKKCSIGLYIQPSGMTKEAFSKYVKQQENLMEEHEEVETYLEINKL
jgi:hypothetical protein